MRRWAALVILVVLGVAIVPGGVLLGAQDGAQDAAECKDGACGSDISAPEYVPGEVLVRFRPGVSEELSQQAMAAEGITSPTIARKTPTVFL